MRVTKDPLTNRAFTNALASKELLIESMNSPNVEENRMLLLTSTRIVFGPAVGPVTLTIGKPAPPKSREMTSIRVPLPAALGRVDKNST